MLYHNRKKAIIFLKNDEIMRVLYLSDLYPPYLTGGAERIVARDITELKKIQNYTIGVLTTQPFFGLTSLLPRKVSIKGITKYSFYPYSPYFIKSNLDRIPRPFRFLELCLSLYNPHSNLITQKVLADFKPDIVNSNYILSLSYGILRNIKKPIVQTFHDYIFGCPKGSYYTSRDTICQNPTLLCRIQNKYIKWDLDHVDKFIVLNKKSEQILYSLGYSRKKIEYLPNGIKIPEIPPNFSEKENIIIYLGQLTKQKGVEVLIKAFKQHLPKNWRLLIIGQGARFNSLKSMASGTSIEMLGYVDDLNLKKLMNKAKILIIPSVWHDVFPTVILEGMINGLAIIGSNVGGIKELITNNVNGYTFRVGDSTDLYSKISLLLNDNEKIKLLCKNSWEIVKKYYNIDDRIKKLSKIYQKLL